MNQGLCEFCQLTYLSSLPGSCVDGWMSLWWFQFVTSVCRKVYSKGLGECGEGQCRKGSEGLIPFATNKLECGSHGGFRREERPCALQFSTHRRQRRRLDTTGCGVSFPIGT